MKAKTKKGILISIGVVILLITLYIAGWPIERVTVTGGKMNYIDEYQNYYFMSMYMKGLFQFGDGTIWIREVYFLPGQKEKILEKLKQDVNNYLEKLIEEHGDTYYKYEISDDFRTVRIYEASGYIDRSYDLGPKVRDYDLGSEVSTRIESLIGLYHNIKEGQSAGFSSNELVVFIKSGD